MPRRIYADHAATTPLLPEVLAAMRPWLESEFGNPSSIHAEGRAARAAIDEAREVLSEELGSLFAEVTFTSSGTEAANMAIFGTALASDTSRRRILLGAADHHCVLHTQERLEAWGFQVDLVPVDHAARLDLQALESMLDDDVLLFSVLYGNNEFGTLSDVHTAVGLCQSVGARVFVDAVQTFGVVPVNVDELGVDMLAVSAHKVYGPKGVGALYIRAGTEVSPLLVGGGQEREMRAGTENPALAVGFAEAVRRFPTLSKEPEPYPATHAFLATLQQHSASDIQQTISHSKIQNPKSKIECLPGHVHLRFPGISAESLLIRLDREGVSASAGAACSAGSLEPSHVMIAAGFTPAEAKEGIRFTFGRSQAAEDGTEAAHRLTCVLNELHRLT